MSTTPHTIRPSLTLFPPVRFATHTAEIAEGWDAFFENKDAKDNPYPDGLRHDAWQWGYSEAMDYGQ